MKMELKKIINKFQGFFADSLGRRALGEEAEEARVGVRRKRQFLQVGEPFQHLLMGETPMTAMLHQRTGSGMSSKTASPSSDRILNQGAIFALIFSNLLF